MSARPVQADALDVTEVEDGLVVFHPETRRVHHLNVTAALVFELCTGENDDAAVVGLVQQAFGLAEPPTQEVAAVIASFRHEGLVV